jgi:hypothetical protein
MFSDDVDADIRKMIADPSFKHREAAQHALAFRQTADVAELVALLDDPHPCATFDLLFEERSPGEKVSRLSA